LADSRAGIEAEARAIAWRDGRWGDRHRIEAELRAQGERAAALLAENDFDEPAFDEPD
jgi:hypothetical protein